LDSSAILEAVRTHRLAFWDAILWAWVQRAGVQHLLTEDFQDGLNLGASDFLTRSILKTMN
jgi:predicted nucleic acid-binding protein